MNAFSSVPATDFDNVRIQPAESMCKQVRPEICAAQQAQDMVVKQAISDADSHSQMIGRERPKFGEQESHQEVVDVSGDFEQPVT
jgi:hypothetical protein